VPVERVAFVEWIFLAAQNKGERDVRHPVTPRSVFVPALSRSRTVNARQSNPQRTKKSTARTIAHQTSGRVAMRAHFDLVKQVRADSASPRFGVPSNTAVR